MSFHITRDLLLLTFLMFFVNFDSLATDQKMVEDKKIYHLVCTSGAKDNKLKEIINDPEYTIASLDLAKASGLDNPLSLFQDPLPELTYLKLKINVDEIVEVLSEKAPNLEVLDISQTNICDLTLLTKLNTLSSLRVLDISNIHFQTKLPSIVTTLLSENKSLTVYIKSLRKMSPLQERMDLSIYKDNPRVVLDTYYSSVKAAPFPLDSSNKLFIY